MESGTISRTEDEEGNEQWGYVYNDPHGQGWLEKQ